MFSHCEREVVEEHGILSIGEISVADMRWKIIIVEDSG